MIVAVALTIIAYSVFHVAWYWSLALGLVYLVLAMLGTTTEDWR